MRIESLLVPRPSLFGAEVAQGDTVFVFPGPQRWGSRDTDFLARSLDEPRWPRTHRCRCGSWPKLSPTGVAAVSDAVSAHLTRCAGATQADAGSSVPGCTQRLFRSAVDGSVKWTAPTDLSGLRYLLRQSAGGDEKDLGIVDVAGAVRWRVAYTPDYDKDGPRVETTDDQYLVGHVDLTAGKPTFTAEPTA